MKQDTLSFLPHNFLFVLMVAIMVLSSNCMCIFGAAT